jgi:hypothetical protein
MKPGYFLIPVLLIALTVTFIVFGCTKSGGKPTLKLESVNTTVQPQDSMIAMFKFGGSSVSNGYFVSIRTRLNVAPLTNQSGPDTLYNPIPSYSSGSGEYRYSLPWNGYLSESANENDTIVFKFYTLTSDTLVSSDTVLSPQIIIVNQ